MEIASCVLTGFALLVVGIAAAWDIKTHKIPNKLTFPAALVGIVLQIIYFVSCGYAGDFWLRALTGAINGILGWFTGVFIMSFTKLFLRKFGHGDTKLVAAVGAILGPGSALLVYFYYTLVFGFYSLIAMAVSLPWWNLWMSSEMKKVGAQDVHVDMEKFNTVRKGIIPVAPFIALGTVLAIVLHKATLEFFGLD